MVTVGGVISFQDCIEQMSKPYNFHYSKLMMRDVKKLTNVYKPLCEEKKIDINWKKLNSIFANPETYMNEFYFKIHNELNPKAFPDKDSLYNKIDATEALKDVNIPTLIISARNDPMRREMPVEEIQANENLILVEAPRGGHMEYMVNYGRQRWYKRVMSKFLNAVYDFEDISNVSTE